MVSSSTPPALQVGEDGLDGGVHVGYGAVVLGDDVLLVRNARGHPAGEVVPEGLEGLDRLHGVVGRVALVAVVEDALEGLRRQVWAVGVHVAQQHEEGPSAVQQPVQLRDDDAVQVLGLLAGPVRPAAPRLVVQVGVEAPGAWVSAQPHAGGVVSLAAQEFRQHRHLGPDRALVAEGDHLGGEDVHAAEHGGVAAGGGDVGAVGVLEQRSLSRQPVDVGRRQAAVAVAAEVVGSQGVDAEYEDVGSMPGVGAVQGDAPSSPLALTANCPGCPRSRPWAGGRR